jgi:hypothetical protein
VRIDQCVSAVRAVWVKVSSGPFHARTPTSQNTSRMLPSQSRVHRKTLKGQTWEVVANVLQFMQKEADRRQFVIPVTKVHERVASATDVSKSALISIKKETLNMQTGAATSYSTPKRNRNRRRPCTKADDFDMCVVRRKIHEFYLLEKRLPTVKAVFTKLRWSIGYKGQASSLLKVVTELGFPWGKRRDNRYIRNTRCQMCACGLFEGNYEISYCI